MTTGHHELSELIHACLDGTATDDQIARLNARLRDDEAARELYLRLADTHSCLAADESLWVGPAADSSLAAARVHPARQRWLAGRPLAAAAVGLVLGLCCASVAWAIVGPSLGKVITLLQEGFETSLAPRVTGVPVEPGHWGGDYSELAGAQPQLKPESGTKMLRFLRGDFEGRDIPTSHSCDVFRLVDVRPYRRDLEGGEAVVQLTAVFNAQPFPAGETFSATLTIFALDAALVGNENIKAENVLSTESLAYSRSTKVVMDRDPGTWQKVSNELRLPPGTDYLMLRIGMSNDTKSPGLRRDSFGGHFVDKLQLVLAQRSEIPVP
ncbi:MAG: hypothetical protein Q8N18_07840 [Opitutaceae bacterium]|nr:hypothetical protein [Opitutaceae bacterium]